MIYSIYKITNNVNGKSYIGFTEDFDRRWRQHKTDYKHKFRPLYNSMRYYGIENFDCQVIYQTPDREHALLEMETYFIKEYDTYNKGYNCNMGGTNTNTDEMRSRASERMKKNNPMKKLRTNSGSFKKGQKPIITEERNRKIAKSKMGKKNPMYGNPDAAKHMNKKIKCPHCEKETNLGNAKRWHFDKCRSREKSF